MMDKQKLVVFGSSKFGIADYIAHLYPHLQNHFETKVLSFSHLSLDDEVKPEDSELFFQQIDDPQLLLRPTQATYLAESYIKMMEFVNEFQPDIFNLQVSSIIKKIHFFFYTFVSELKKRGVKIIYTLHDVEAYEAEQAVTFNIVSAFYNVSDAMFVGNEDERKRLLDTYSYDKPVEIITHGVYDLFDQQTTIPKEARKELGYKDNDFVVLFFGALRENKGLDDLVKAMGELKDNSDAAHIKLYVAAGVRGNYKIIDEYHKMADELRVTDRVTFNFIKIDAFKLHEMETFFKACDIVALPYTSISQSGILNLAIGFKKLVIVTDAFYEAKEVKDKLGLVIPKKNPRELADAILTMKDQKVLFEKQFNDNIEAYYEKHSWESMAEKMLQLSQKI